MPHNCWDVARSGSGSPSFQRREVMGRAASLMMSLLSLPVLAAEEDFKLYLDEADKFSLLVPPGNNQSHCFADACTGWCH